MSHPDQLLHRLQQLHASRGRIQAEVIDRLMVLDSIDRSIDTTLADLAEARRTAA